MTPPQSLPDHFSVLKTVESQHYFGKKMEFHRHHQYISRFCFVRMGRVGLSIVDFGLPLGLGRVESVIPHGREFTVVSGSPSRPTDWGKQSLFRDSGKGRV